MQDPGFVRRAFSEIADRYVLTNHVLSLGTDILWRRRFVRDVRLRAPNKLLDVATGSGDVAAEVRRQCPDTQVVGADFCQPMLAHARRHGLDDLIVADGLRLPFHERSFDAVTVAFGLRNMASWFDALEEWRRILKPGASLHILDFSHPTWQPFKGCYLFYLRSVLPRIAGWLTGRRQAYEYLSTSIDQFPQGAEMIKLLRESGYENVTAHSLTGGIAAIYVAEKPASGEGAVTNS